MMLALPPITKSISVAREDRVLPLLGKCPVNMVLILAKKYLLPRVSQMDR